MKIEPGEAQTAIFAFGNFHLDGAKRLLLKSDGETVPVMPKAFDTLLYLAERSGKVVEKDDLMSGIWADRVVEENNLTQNISALRRVLGEKYGENRFIATVPGRGYKFVAEVRRLDTAEHPEPPPTVAAPLPEPEIHVAADSERTTRSRTARRTWLGAWIVAGIFGLSVFGFYLWRENANPVPAAPVKTVAVLPFKPLVGENRNEALEMGMTTR